MIKPAGLIIFDDCLSAVDAKTEREIMARLNKYLEEKTAIIITHRVFSLLSADRIVVMDEGKIAEQGTHAELMNIQNGLYHSGSSDSLKLTKEDSVRIRTIYTKYGYIINTINYFKNSIYPDSVTSWSAGFTKEWKTVKDTFYVINPKDYVFKEIPSDTTTIADSLKKTEEIKPEKREEIRKIGDGIQVVVN